MPEIRTVDVTRYVTPLREGGSLPAIVEADDGFMYVLKFRGAGQGVKTLIAELVGTELARTAGLKIPELVFAKLEKGFGMSEPDEEIQDLLKASTGLNLAFHYLSGAVTYDPLVNRPDEWLASRILWLDYFLNNVDRTSRNTNMLWWQKEHWLIDFGASLYFHHSWIHWEEHATRPFSLVRDHVLLPLATKMQEADAWMHELLNEYIFTKIMSLVPDEWLETDVPFSNAGETRKAYLKFLSLRFHHSKNFIKEIYHAGN